MDKTINAFVEHMQIVVSDLNIAESFYMKVFSWEIRARGHEQAADRSYYWVHIGTEDSYLAFRTPYDGTVFNDSHKGHAGNHIGIVVPDRTTVIKALEELDVKFRHAVPHPYRERLYFRDFDGNEIEVIEYLSDHPHERNDYTI